ncbi:MAG: hypothetical protein PHD37_17720 [Gallionellaceae bacterium]|nr:hypothetical protein [Gallionellaceae bacterium]
MKKLIAMVLAGVVLAGCGKNEPAGQQVAAPIAQPCAIDETHDQPHTFDAVRDLAMKGNYQAQRNLAFGYAGGMPYKGQDVNPILGCAWYKVVLLSGSEKVNQTDTGNVQVFCGKLSADEQAAAERQAQVIHSKLCK